MDCMAISGIMKNFGLLRAFWDNLELFGNYGYLLDCSSIRGILRVGENVIESLPGFRILF